MHHNAGSLLCGVDILPLTALDLILKPFMKNSNSNYRTGDAAKSVKISYRTLTPGGHAQYYSNIKEQ